MIRGYLRLLTEKMSTLIHQGLQSQQEDKLSFRACRNNLA